MALAIGPEVAILPCRTRDPLARSAEKRGRSDTVIYSEEEHKNNLRYHLRAGFLQLVELREAGLEPDASVRLDFHFESLNRGGLLHLRSFLEAETGYSFRLKETDGEYVLQGRTDRTLLTPDLLNTWVNWMCRAGEACDCLFAGWWIAPQNGWTFIRRATPRAGIPVGRRRPA